MAALCPNRATALPFLPALRSPPRRLSPTAFVASVVRPRGPRIVLRGSRHPDLPARNSVWFENATMLRTEHKKKALFASETDSPTTDSSKRSDDNSSPPDGPPVLTILAGIIVFFLVLWVIGSIFTWIVGLVFGAAKS
ncbi:uncharacterized protein LOC104581893 [Brachypodium distachyon]|uniref:Uncharacterized protein n=1 Tax=Brachypodium distachyon TaxID=15368 RepID=I1HA75_BRADI|nr:uncharacterized protein LOC104581893 [Brachypodium distachyon]KQK23863.1 hypothetical protein BRADI_1g76600v3 [Brachypodium distachyon]|eukprot:XP_010229270.1 uncharacterized protein LOC104581893 [Brachypodium distachyon]